MARDKGTRMQSADKWPAVFDSAGWVDAGAKVDSRRWSRWDDIEEVQEEIGWADYSPTIDAREALMVALNLAEGPEGTEHMPDTETVDNGKGHALADGSDSRAAGIVTVWTAAGVMLARYWTLRGGKRRHDIAADERKRKASPEALAARRARSPQTPEAAAADVARRRGKRADARALRALAVTAGGREAGAAD